MGGIAVPQDRTLSQPVVGFCRNPLCIEKAGQEFRFKVEHDRFACPKCGADRAPMVGALVLTHLIIPAVGGPINGRGGTTHRLACDSTRAYLATATNLEAATDNAQVANCPGCLAEAEKLGMYHPTSRLLQYAKPPAKQQTESKRTETLSLAEK